MVRPSTPSLVVSDADDERSVNAQRTRIEDPQNDLVQASSKNPSIILELDMDGNVMYLSKSWESYVGTSIKKILHRPMSETVLGSEDDKKVFTDATEIMMADDNSYRVRFVVATNTTKVESEDDYEHDHENILESDTSDDRHSDKGDRESLSSISTNGEMIELEGQGILIHDNHNVPTHSMWILKPFDSGALNVQLPLQLAQALGFGADIFTSYLSTLSEAGIINDEDVPPPPQVLCRICETHVPSWWLEKHSQLCYNEHKCESDVQIIHDALLEQRQIISNINGLLNKESIGISDGKTHDYKGLPLPHVGLASDHTSTSRTSTPLRRGRSGSMFSTLRFPFKTLALLSELCDYAIKINPSEFDEEQNTYEFSPNTKEAFLHVISSEIPSSSDPAINLLSSDTEKLTNEKVEAVSRMKSSLLYSKKIKDEIDELILLTIKETVKNIRNQTNDVIPHSNSYSSNSNQSSDMLEAKSVQPLQQTSLASPRPTLFQSNIFTDAYLGTDSLPSPSVSFRQELLDSKGRFSPSRSITPNECITKDNHSDHHETFPSLNDLAIKSPVLTPQRKASPGVPLGYHNSPMSSIQRNIRTHGSGDSYAGTPTSSPLFLAHDPSEFLDRKSITNDYFLSSNSGSSNNIKPPLSPLLVAAPALKPVAPSIKDYEILKPISKGAFGSVYLARRKVTGDYFAIKVLKKSDMIAKNQVTNVKAERAVMMAQSDSPYVARLFSSFQSKDYLFLVMEYLPGGDCATLLKMLGNLPDQWAKQYIAQVVVGVQDLHQKGIVHHDLKPDNLLIDSTGHLKLTDFGLSRMGLIRRQETLGKNSSVSEEAFNQATTSTNPKHHRKDSISTFALSPDNSSSASSPIYNYFESAVKDKLRSESQGSIPGSPFLKPLHVSASQTSFVISDDESGIIATPNSKNLVLYDPENTTKNKKFVGTPDYLSPETIAGAGESEASDWWSVGCILFEFLFGYPPFHDTTPERVFANILAGKIDWPNLSPEEEKNFCTPLAKDLILKLLKMDPQERLGSSSADEIFDHPYFDSVKWDQLWDSEGSFVPTLEDPESTEYFEARGAEMNDFSLDGSDSGGENDDSNGDQKSQAKAKNVQNTTTILGSPSASNSPTQKHLSLAIPLHMRERRPSKLNDSTNEFGSFQFRNLPALDKANKDILNRIRAEHLEHRNSMSSSSSESGYVRSRNYSMSSPTAFKRSSSPSASILRSQSPGRGSFSSGNTLHTPLSGGSFGPFVSATSDDYPSSYFEISGRSSPSTDSGSPSTKTLKTPTQFSLSHPNRHNSRGHILQRTLSEFSPSSSDTEDPRTSALERVRKRRQSSKMSDGSATRLQMLDILLCEPIPILRYQLKKDLEALGCAVVAVAAGDELIRRATGEVKFDTIITALKVNKLDILDLIKLLKHTSSVNSETPIIAVTAYYKEAVYSGVFADVLEKPVHKRQLRGILEKHCRLKVAQAEEAISDTEGLSDADITASVNSLTKS